MLAILTLLFFLACGLVMARFLLPALRPPVRGYIGLSIGIFLLMWLPALVAYLLAFTLAAHAVAAALMLALVALSYRLRDQRPLRRMDATDRARLRCLLILLIPMMLLAGYLQYTHSIRPDADGGYHVGQSTYGDLSLHLAVTTSAVNASFPLHNSLMLGATMAYPYLSDTLATTFYMMGFSLPAAMAFTGTLMMSLTFAGYTLLCLQLCKRRAAAMLAVCLLFFNGGLGFFYTLSGQVQAGQVTTVLDNLKNVMGGYYQTPTNQPDPNNLRWVNIICDMLVPQRGILGGWTILMPCLNLLLPPLCRKEAHGLRALILLGMLAGGLPLIHTHSFLALALLSAGICLYQLASAQKGMRLLTLKPWLWYAGITALLALPQLFGFTFVQATGSDHFLRPQFNWCNNRGGKGLVDPYFWFYVKNIGLPYLLILLALLQRRPKTPSPAQAEPPPRDFIGQNRMLACGAFLIYLVAELFIFQPNEYDNNKLFYVWFLLCLPMASEYAFLLFERLKGLGGRRVIAGLFLGTCFLSAYLTVARECVSDYSAYSAQDLEVADFVRKNTPEHSVILTSNQHLNPISSLAGRTILCSSDLYLYYHGFNTQARRAQVTAIYQQPLQNLALLKEYGVQYIYVSGHERSNNQPDEDALAALFPVVYQSADGTRTLYEVPADVGQTTENTDEEG